MRITYGGLQLGAANSARFTWGRALTRSRAGVGVGFLWNVNFGELLFRCSSQVECAYLSGLVSAGTAIQENDLAVYNDDGTFSDHIASSGGLLALGKQLAGRSAFVLAAVGTVAAAAYGVHHMAGNYIDQQKREGDAYMTARQRDELNVRNSGFGLESIRGMALDFGRSRAGGYAKVGAADRRQSEDDIRAGFEDRVGAMRSSGDAEIRKARLREAEFKRMNDSRRDPRNLDRSTPDGRQVYEDLHGPRRDHDIDRSAVMAAVVAKAKAGDPRMVRLIFDMVSGRAAERVVIVDRNDVT